MTQTFFAANYADGGLCNRFSDILAPYDHRFIIKGGAGYGKSTCLRALSRALTAEGYSVVHLACASDPGSLDGLLCPALSVAAVDGTPPHVVEPRCPGVVDCVIDLYAALQPQKLTATGEDFLALEKDIKTHHQFAAAHVQIAADCTRKAHAIQQLDASATALTARELYARIADRAGETTFADAQTANLSAVTPRGLMGWWDNLAQTPMVFVLEGGGAAGHGVLARLAQRAAHDGLARRLCPDPLLPEQWQAVFFPEAGVAVVTEQADLALPHGCSRHVLCADALATPPDSEWLARREASIAAAVGEMARAKQAHDRLEALYRPAIDFAIVERAAQGMIEQVLSLGELP